MNKLIKRLFALGMSAVLAAGIFTVTPKGLLASADSYADNSALLPQYVPDSQVTLRISLSPR